MTISELIETLQEYEEQDGDTIVVDHNGWTLLGDHEYCDALHFDGSPKVAFLGGHFTSWYRKEYPGATEVAVLRLG